jgi:thiol:disulfide interchange protein
MRCLRTLFIALGLAALPAAALAQPVRADHLEAELVAASDAIVPGQPLTVALRLKHDPQWHTYWQVPGDSGLPTRIGWQLPQGWSAGAIQWPVPKRLPIGPLMNYGYEGETFLLTDVTPPPNVKPGGTMQIRARAEWLVCREVCIPGDAQLQLALPVRSGAQTTAWAAPIAAARARVPKALDLAQQQATFEAPRLRLAFQSSAPVHALEFFPLQEARIEAAAPQHLRREGDLQTLYLQAASTAPASDFTSLRGVVVANGGPAQAGGWAAEVIVPVVAGSVATIAGTAPGAATALTLGAALLGALVGGLLLNLMPCVFPVLSLKLLSLVQDNREDDAAHRPHASLRMHGAAYGAGVVISFVLLAGALFALRLGGAQLGWGFQLQTPWVVVLLAALFFAVGLNLLGAFEFTLGTGFANSGVAARLQGRSLRGSVATGALAVIVAAPCTAPFMGAALGYAITQPGPEALAVFGALGIGMAAPYVLLTAFPSLLARLPRPGAWMERFKQAMAFPMFATTVWLLWVLAQQVGIDAAALVLGALVLLGFAAWALGLAQRGARAFRWVAIASGIAAIYAGSMAAVSEFAAAPAQAAVQRDHAAWQPWTPTQQQTLLARREAVFVDFTAAWCVTCQANKRLVLNGDRVAAAFASKQVALLRADWTQRDDAITRELARFRRNGVPLYVLYDRSGRAQVLPELLTERTVLEALAAIQ